MAKLRMSLTASYRQRINMEKKQNVWKDKDFDNCLDDTREI